MDTLAQNAVADDFGRVRINFVWLYKLRWAAVMGQALTVVAVHFWLGIALPVLALTSVIALTAASNVAYERWFRRMLRVDPESFDTGASARRWLGQGQLLMGCVTIADLLFLTALLHVTGGWRNPFAVFYLVHLALAAVVLPSRWTWGLTAFGILSYFALAVDYDRLMIFEDPQYYAQHRQGTLIAFAGACAIIVYFVTRIHSELAENLGALEAERKKKARLERVEALVTLAAGAAHELSTPLSTIAVVAKELEIELEGSEGAWGEDVQLIRREVRRCRGILEQMAEGSGTMVGQGLESMSMSRLVAAVIEPLHAEERIELDLAAEAADEVLEIPGDALRRALRGLVKNALDASPPEAPVRVRAWTSGARALLEIVDHGEGMDEHTLARAEDPFFTTKDPGRGMGLGLHLARSVIERIEGRLEIVSRPGQGTRVHVDLPLRPVG